MVFSLYRVGTSKDSFLKSISCSTGRTSNMHYTVTFQFYLEDTVDCEEYSSAEPQAAKYHYVLIWIISRPYSIQGKAKVFHMWNETNGFIPEFP